MAKLQACGVESHTGIVNTSGREYQRPQGRGA